MTINGFDDSRLLGMMLLLLRENPWTMLFLLKDENMFIHVQVSPKYTLIFEIG